ncbi:MAG: transketolase C-terminal domain-containing protein [Gemmataceae bacterium]|nr:transketolase C-terminal domain-containing protein [Gemmataceae bacterium]
MTRELTYHQAIREALDLCLEHDRAVCLAGLGATDPKGIFGTTLGLDRKHGHRVLDMPCSENGMTGILIGAALVGMKPVMVHQRVDFALLALEQILNQAAKWHYMFGGRQSVPLVIRLIIGRGWGQGPQHSQSLHSFFAHVPGLRVVMPATPGDAKGLLIAAVDDPNPVIYLEHRWLHNVRGSVPPGIFHTPIGSGRVMRPGKDVTIVAVSYMCLEALRAAGILVELGIDAEVIDLRSLRPWDADLVCESVDRTGRLVVVDTSWKLAGFSAEVLATVVERCLPRLRCPPRRIALPDCPTPTSPALARHFYPTSADIVTTVCGLLGRQPPPLPEPKTPADVPDPTFTGPF